VTFPDDPAVMLLLLAVYTGQRVGADDGRMTLEVPGVDGPVALDGLDSALDALESRGWVTIEDAGPACTEQGRYALARWMNAKVGRRRFASAGNLHMRAVR
jgi:hypothetical protein